MHALSSEGVTVGVLGVPSQSQSSEPCAFIDTEVELVSEAAPWLSKVMSPVLSNSTSAPLIATVPDWA